MAERRRKIKRCVIDVNTFITIFLNRETEWLFQYVIRNKIELYIDSHLMDELLRVLDYPRIKKRLPLDKRIYANFVLLISTPIVATEFHVNSPDKEDNYLYDFALTAHAKLLVTEEKALLNWAQSPIETINLTSFKELF